MDVTVHSDRPTRFLQAALGSTDVAFHFAAPNPSFLTSKKVVAGGSQYAQQPE